MEKKKDSVVTFPSEMVDHIAYRLCDLDWNLGFDEASVEAYNIVVEVTMAVDKLRESENGKP